VKLSDVLSREKVVNGVKSVGKLRPKMSHSSVLTLGAVLIILFVAFTIRILPIRWEIQAGSVHLSEFDPYYQYALTNHMVNDGLFSPYWPTHWVDTTRWYPEGIDMGNSLPSLPLTTAFFYDIVTALGANINLMAFCAFMPVLFGTLSVFLLYFLGKDLGGKPVGILAALFLALNPAVIQRSALGFFDTETTGVFSLILFSLLFLRAIDTEKPIKSTIMYSLGAAGALAYFVLGWGAAYYLIGLTALFAFVMILLKRYSRRLLLAYSISFGLGLLVAINFPYISTNYLTSFAVLPVLGVFVLLLLTEIVRNVISARGKTLFVIVFLAALVGGFSALWALGYGGNIAGKFFSVLDPALRDLAPLVESVAEHRITAWGSVYYDLGISILFFIVGLFFVARNLTTRNLFLLLFGLTALYFGSSMVRLLVIFGPAFGLLVAIAVVSISRPFVTLLKEPPKITVKRRVSLGHVGREFSGVAIFLIFIVLMTNIAFSPQTGGIPNVYRQAYAPVTVTAGSLPIVPNAPVDEWFDMLAYLNNFHDSTVIVVSWWDYGYWLTILGNVTTLTDNGTINSTQIQNTGFIFMGNETQALQMLKKYNATYILVFVTVGLSLDQSTQTYNAVGAGYGDEGKWTWMARISGAADSYTKSQVAGWDWENETAFGAFDNTTNAWKWNERGINSTVYKLMYWGKHVWAVKYGIPDPDEGNVTMPVYFQQEYFAGLDLSPQEASTKYGGLIPLVCLYKINYPEG
jgi:dolichyl-diphosphooligosaccharide--protein glycosyltransferase